MNNSINSRIKEVRKDLFGGINKKFAEALGEHPNTTSNWVREGYSVGRGVVSKISNTLNVDYDWLLTGKGEKYLTGEGEMLKGRPTPESFEDGSGFAQGKIIPLFDAAAIGGNSHGMDMTPARQIEMIQIGGFLRESESALRVYGNSMTPNYPPGCIVGTKQWNERFIEPGRVYVLETRENRFLKRLYYNMDKTAYRCLSDNTMLHESGPAKGEFCYPEFEIPIEDVFRLHKVIGVIKRSTI